MIARLKDGVGVEQAQAEVTALAARLEQASPASNDGKGAIVVPLQEQLVGDTRPTLNLLAGAVGLVLLIASANVANLLLARASAQATELGVRAALGASRGCLVAQLVTESLILGIVIGCALAYGLAQLLRGMLFAVAPADPIVFIGVPLALLATGAAATAIPALRASRVNPIQALRAE